MSYFTSTETYWITWGPMAYGVFALLRALSEYRTHGGVLNGSMATVFALALLGGAAGASVALTEWQIAQIAPAEERAVALWNEATDHTDAVFGRTEPWGAADVADMTTAAALLDNAATTLSASLPPFSLARGISEVRLIADALRERAELARRLARSSSDAEREGLFSEWDQQSNRLLELAAALDGQAVSESSASAERTAAPTAAPTASPTPAPTATPLPTPRPVALRPDQVIVPPAQFPFSGYRVTVDEASGSWGWLRSFDSRSATYNFVAMVVYVFGPTDQGTSVVSAFDCSAYADPGGRPVKATALTAEAVGDGARACRYEIGGGALVYAYMAATRNVVVHLESNPRLAGMTDATAMRDLIAVARLQFQIIDSLAPQ